MQFVVAAKWTGRQRGAAAALLCGAAPALHVSPSAQRYLPHGTTTSSHSLFPITSSLVSSSTQLRFFATGTRGARGHGWFVKYRQGRGGRHLQGEYFDRDGTNTTDTQQQQLENTHKSDLESKVAWNDAIVGLGSKRVYMTVELQPKATGAAATEGETVNDQEEPSDSETTTVTDESAKNKSMSSDSVRLEMDLASTVLGLTCRNFVELMSAPETTASPSEETFVVSYKGTRFYRLERDVGWCGGDVLSNTGKTGCAATTLLAEQLKVVSTSPLEEEGTSQTATPRITSPTELDVASGTFDNGSGDPLVMWHVPGTVTMIQPKVDCVDSRFMMLTHDAPHLDGIHRAFGRLTPESLQILMQWEKDLLTRKGVPTLYDLRIIDCGEVLDATSASNQDVVAGAKRMTSSSAY